MTWILAVALALWTALVGASTARYNSIRSRDDDLSSRWKTFKLELYVNAYRALWDLRSDVSDLANAVIDESPHLFRDVESIERSFRSNEETLAAAEAAITLAAPQEIASTLHVAAKSIRDLKKFVESRKGGPKFQNPDGYLESSDWKGKVAVCGSAADQFAKLARQDGALVADPSKTNAQKR